MTIPPIDLSARRAEVLAKAEGERGVWVCNCGCTVHYLRGDDIVECSNCQALGNGTSGKWRQRLAAIPDHVPELDADNFKVIHLDSPRQFINRRLKDDIDDAVAILHVHKDGSLAIYRENEVESDWLLERLNSGRDRIMSVVKK